MTNQMVYLNANFKFADSPATINLRNDLGVESERSVLLVNSGPGVLLVSVSYDDGVTFETPAAVSPRISVTGSVIDNADQIIIEHSGVDSNYAVLAVAASMSPIIMSFPDPKLYSQDNYLSVFLLDGVVKDMAVDGSITPVEYNFTVPTDRRVKLSRAFITIEDGPLAFRPGDFGAISGPLANGVEVSVTPSGGSKTVLELWQTNREIRNTYFDFDASFRTDGQYVGRWTITEDFDGGELFLNDSDKFSVLIQDDLGPLDFMSYRLKGVILDIS